MRRLTVCLFFCFMLLPGGIPEGRCQPTADIIHACSDKDTGVMRMVQESERCRPSETALTWNGEDRRSTPVDPGGQPRERQVPTYPSAMTAAHADAGDQAYFRSQIYIDGILLMAAAVSLVVGLIAIWLSVLFHRASARLTQEAREAAKGIDLNAERLEHLVNRLHGDILGLMKDTVSLHRAVQPSGTGLSGSPAAGGEPDAPLRSAQPVESQGEIFVRVPTPSEPAGKAESPSAGLCMFKGKRLEHLLEHGEIADGIKGLTGKYYGRLLENLRISGKISVDSAGNATITGTAPHMEAIEEGLLHLGHDGGIHAAILTQGEKILYFTNRNESRGKLITPVREFLKRFTDVKVILMTR